MNNTLRRTSRLIAIATVTVLFSLPARADDPHLLSASPVMLPGANQAVCDQLARTAAFSSAMNTNVHAQTLQMPSSLSSCLSDLLGQAETLNNAFDQSGSFNISAIFTAALNKRITTTLSNLANKACQKGQKFFNTVENGLIPHVSFSNMMGGRFAVTAQIKPNTGNGTGGGTGTGTGSGGTSDPDADAEAQQIADEQSQPDDLDNVANSMGFTITANSPVSAGLATTPNYIDDTATDPATALPASYPMDSNYTSPNNATICIPPDPRNDIPRDTATLDGDSPLLNPANANSGNDDGSEDEFLEGGSSAPSTGNPVVPQGNATPKAGDTPANTDGKFLQGSAAPNPASTASANGTAGCTSPNPQTSGGGGGVTSGGTNCTANMKNGSACMAGSGCSPQNGNIGASKDYQTGAIFAHGPYGSGSNLGQCAQLSQALVPNVGHTTGWRRGPAVFPGGSCNKTLQFGTVVATFFGPAQTPGATLAGQPAQTVYNYEPHTPNVYEQHTGIFVGCSADGMAFIEEYKGLPAPHKRIMEIGKVWDGTMASLTRNKNNEMHAAINYYVVVH